MDKSILMARRENQLQIAAGHEETSEIIAISGVLVAAAGLEFPETSIKYSRLLPKRPICNGFRRSIYHLLMIAIIKKQPLKGKNKGKRETTNSLADALNYRFLNERFRNKQVGSGSQTTDEVFLFGSGPQQTP